MPTARRPLGIMRVEENRMASTLNLKTKVLPGKRIEITAAELNEGDIVEVQLTLPEPNGAQEPKTSILEFLNSLPPGPRSAPTWEEIERNFQAERDAWDR